MDTRNVILRNVAMVDLTKASDEKLLAIKRIENCAMVVMREDRDISGIEFRNTACVMRVPGDAVFKVMNGSSVISSGDTGANIYLLANGSLTIDPDVTPEMIAARYVGMMINGSLYCSRSINAALDSLGAHVNGSVSTYPDGAILRSGRFVLDMDTAQTSAPGIYAVDELLALDAGAVSAAKERGMTFFTESVICAAALKNSVMALMFECAPEMTIVPEGFEFMERVGKVDRLRARKLRGSVFACGDVELDFTVKPADLSALRALHATGNLIMTEAQFDELADVDFDCAELRLREASDMTINDDYRLNAAALESLEGKRSLTVNGDFTLEDDVTPQLLRDKFSAIVINGDVIASKDLFAVLPELGNINGDMVDPKDSLRKSMFGEKDDAREEGMVYVENVAKYEA